MMMMTSVDDRDGCQTREIPHAQLGSSVVEGKPHQETDCYTYLGSKINNIGSPKHEELLNKIYEMGKKQDGPQNEDIWREANIGPMTTFIRKRRLRCYGHVLRREGEDTTNKMLNIQVGEVGACPHS